MFPIDNSLKGAFDLKKTKGLTLLISLLLILTVTVQGTLAYIVAESDLLTNIFDPIKTPVSSLVINKVVEHPFGEDYKIPENIAFDVKVDLGVNYANATVSTDHGEKLADEQGSFTLTVKPGIPVGVDGITEGTVVTVTELPTTLAGFALKEGVEATQTTTILAEGGASVEFVNVYTPAPVKGENITLDGVKELEGRDWQEGDIFSFLLEQQTGEDVWTSLGTKDTVYSADTADYEKFNFNDIIQAVEFASVGEYKFRMTEIAGELDNVDYDKTVKTFTVFVTDVDMDGKLEIANVEGKQNTTVTYDEESDVFAIYVVFNNTFVPDPDDITVSLDVDKTVTNNKLYDESGVELETDEWTTLEGFEFVLEPVVAEGEASSPLKLVTDKDGNARFELVYGITDEGVHEYKLYETQGDIEGMSYSQVVYSITVTVTHDETENILVPEIKVNGEVTEDTAFEFVNVFTPPTPVDPGDKTSFLFYVLMAGISAIGVVLLFIARKIKA